MRQTNTRKQQRSSATTEEETRKAWHDLGDAWMEAYEETYGTY